MKAKVKPPGNSTYDYLIIIDFEATCQENNLNYNHEIIEFPAVLVDCHTREIVSLDAKGLKIISTELSLTELSFSLFCIFCQCDWFRDLHLRTHLVEHLTCNSGGLG